MMMKIIPFFLTIILMQAVCSQGQTSHPLWKTSKYTVYTDKVVQDKYTASANSANELSSDYKSGANNFKPSLISFKFSINGKDNEMTSGVDHHFDSYSENGDVQTPLIKFGTPLKTTKSTKETFLKDGTRLKVRLDMREVLSAFKEQGFYTTFKGDKIYEADFKGVYVAGGTPPLIWDFDNLVNHSELKLEDNDKDGIYEITLPLKASEESKQTATSWKQTKNTDAFPQYHSPYVLSDALYNLSLEEMMNAIEPDSTFRTGKEWAGVWTRDISYSIILSMASLQPAVAKYSLLRKVNKKKKIIQDTGTGGAWPISSDRMIWAVAAWELYKVTGDRDWLEQAYIIIKNSLLADYETIYDKETGLVKGESSFLDWRDQTYPKWMQPADIFESENLGTNAVHYQANIILGKMAAILHMDNNGALYAQKAQQIKKGINKYLWMPAKKYYGQYLYGRFHPILSPRSEALGEALSVIFDIAGKEQQEQIVANTPVTNFGIPCIYPQIPNIPPYHNNAVWPFVQTYWLWAAKKTANENAVMESIAAIYRPAALFLTNKENFVSETGDYMGTQINSSNMLWSLSGNLSIVHKVLFGIQFEDSYLEFKPFVPSALKGKRRLENYTYRNAVLDIEMEGYGNLVKSFMIDDKLTTKAIFPGSLHGKHTIRIILGNNTLPQKKINKVKDYFTLPAPVVKQAKSSLTWDKIEGTKNYKVYKNGLVIKTVLQNSIPVDANVSAEYSVEAVDKSGVSSFLSEPVFVYNERDVKMIEMEDYAGKASNNYKGFSGEGFVEITTTSNTQINVPVEIAADGYYLINCRYANGNGPTNTENKCAIRTVKVDDKKSGVLVFPQRGKNEWSDWGFTNSVKVFLTKGKHQLTLEYTDANENMNLEVNQAMIDYMRITRY